MTSSLPTPPRRPSCGARRVRHGYRIDFVGTGGQSVSGAPSCAMGCPTRLPPTGLTVRAGSALDVGGGPSGSGGPGGGPSGRGGPGGLASGGGGHGGGGGPCRAGLCAHPSSGGCRGGTPTALFCSSPRCTPLGSCAFGPAACAASLLPTRRRPLPDMMLAHGLAAAASPISLGTIIPTSRRMLPGASGLAAVVLLVSL